MKNRMRQTIFLILIVLAAMSAARAQTTAFTYQGKLTDGAAAANGIYDLQFTLYDSSGSALGALVSCNGAAATGNVCEDVSVANGVFTVLIDFGAAAFDGTTRTLGIGVRQGNQTGAFTTLAPRQPITSVPYAMRSLFAVDAQNAFNSTQLGGVAAGNYLLFNSNGSLLLNLNASSIASGTLGDSFLSSNVAFRNQSNTFTANQTFNGNLTQTGTTTNLSLTDGFVTSGTLGTGAIPISGAGVRTMFYPNKAAFRAGRVDSNQWDDANIGLLSVALGNNTRATNRAAFAAGENTTASGANSTALGELTTASGVNSTALGYNTTASGVNSTALGEFTTASGGNSTALGYDTTASGLTSTALGESTTASGDFTTALGYRASTNNQRGSFVYGDASTTIEVAATAPHQFVVRAAGGFRFRTAADLSTGCNLPAGGGAFQCTSSRALKENFVNLNGADILQRLRRVPVFEWSYKNESKNVRHIGAFAEDFYREFKLGTDDKSIGLLDIAGVNTAAIKELDGEMQNNAAEIKTLRTENDALELKVKNQQQQIDDLKTVVCAIKPEAEVCRNK